MNVWSIQDHLGFSSSFDAFLHIIVFLFFGFFPTPDSPWSSSEWSWNNTAYPGWVHITQLHVLCLFLLFNSCSRTFSVWWNPAPFLKKLFLLYVCMPVFACVFVCVLCVCGGVWGGGGVGGGGEERRVHWAVFSQLLLKSCSIRPCRFQVPRGLATGLWDVTGWLFGQTPLPG